MKTKKQEQEWLKARLKIVGASEISTVIKSECTKEEIEKAMGGSADEFLKDNLFQTPFSLYCRKKQLVEPKPFSAILSEFGHEMEKYATMYANLKFKEILTTENKPQKLIYCKDLHKLCAYTPDAFINFKKDCDFLTKKGKIKANDKAVFEIKTSNIFKFKSDNWGILEGQEEVTFQYIIQAQYQLWIQNRIDNSCKWSVIACILPKEKELDNNFTKGKAVAWCQDLTENNFKKLQENYSIFFWIYPVFKSLHPLFEKALNKWDERLQNCNVPIPDIQNIKDIETQKDFFKNKYDEILVYSQANYGADEKGIIQITPAILEKYPNMCDEFRKDKLDREVKLTTEKQIKINQAKFTNILLEMKCLGFNFDESTIHLSKNKRGYLILRNNFKTSQENIEGKVKVKDIITTKEFLAT